MANNQMRVVTINFRHVNRGCTLHFIGCTRAIPQETFHEHVYTANRRGKHSMSVCIPQTKIKKPAIILSQNSQLSLIFKIIYKAIQMNRF